MELQITDQACVQWHNKCNMKVPWDMYVWCHCTGKYVHLDFTQFVITQSFFVIFISYVWFGECNFSAGPIMCKKAMGRFWSRIGQKGQPLLLERAIALQEVRAASEASCSFLRFPDSWVTCSQARGLWLQRKGFAEACKRVLSNETGAQSINSGHTKNHLVKCLYF